MTLSSAALYLGLASIALSEVLASAASTMTGQRRFLQAQSSASQKASSDTMDADSTRFGVYDFAHDNVRILSKNEAQQVEFEEHTSDNTESDATTDDSEQSENSEQAEDSEQEGSEQESSDMDEEDDGMEAADEVGTEAASALGEDQD